MMNEATYRRFMDALRAPERIPELAAREPALSEPIPVDLLVAHHTEDAWRQAWEHVEIAPLALLDMWRRRPDIIALSAAVMVAQAARRTCITRCDDGSVREALCSETADDIVNCTQAVTQQCGTVGAVSLLKLKGPPIRTDGGPRVQRPATA